MPAISSSAPGKIILFGEHAVVYHRPAIAVPVHHLQTKVYLTANPTAPSGQVKIHAPDIGLNATLAELPDQHPFSLLFKLIRQHFRITRIPAVHIKIKSDIPIASGLGSGTAVSVALIRGIAQFLAAEINDQDVSDIAYEVEKIYHGTPSGIDNTVISYEQPVYYVKGEKPVLVAVPRVMQFAIGISGVRSKTSKAVAQVRDFREREEEFVESLFDEIGEISFKARKVLEEGSLQELGSLMNSNHLLLERLGVSNKVLNTLVNAACASGALGAKLSGAGLGGNVIALVTQSTAAPVQQALLEAGAVFVYLTKLHAAC